MGKCWNCGYDVFLKEDETRCDRCKQIVRYWCNSCKEPFDVQDKETKKKVIECKWCGYFLCPSCNACSPVCSRYTHEKKIKDLLKPLVAIDKWDKIELIAKSITSYFEDVKMGRPKTMCESGVPKTYAKTRIKEILARIKGFRVKDFKDKQAFEDRQNDVLSKDVGEELTIGNTRDLGTYGQEWRDVFNLCVCTGQLRYERKSFKNEKGFDIGYDSWTVLEDNKPCPYLDINELIVKYCPNCNQVFQRETVYCNECTYTKGGKNHEKGSYHQLKEKLSNNPTCKNLQNFKEEDEIGESEFKGDD